MFIVVLSRVVRLICTHVAIVLGEDLQDLLAGVSLPLILLALIGNKRLERLHLLIYFGNYLLIRAVSPNVS